MPEKNQITLACDRMSVKIFCKDKIEREGEFEQTQEIIEIINKEFSNSPEDVYIFVNTKIFTNEPAQKGRKKCQIDCAILPPKGILLLELKAIQGVIEGGKEGKWYFTNNGIRKEIHFDKNENVFEQAQINRSFFCKRFTDPSQSNGEKKGFTHGYTRAEFFSITNSCAYFMMGSTYTDNRINRREDPWFDVITGESLLRKISTLKPDYPLTSTEIDEFVRDLELHPYDYMNNRCLGELQADARANTEIAKKSEDVSPHEKPHLIDTKLQSYMFDQYGDEYLKKHPPNYRKALEAFESSLELYPDPDIQDKAEMCMKKLKESAELPAVEKYTKNSMNQETGVPYGVMVSGHFSGLIPQFEQRPVDSLIDTYDFAELYKKYSWKNDSWSTGFRDIFRLELELVNAAKTNTLNYQQILKIAQWGGHYNPEKIRCRNKNGLLSLSIFNESALNQWILDDPAHAIDIVRPQIIWFGPTFLSKIFRFALPSYFGSIDRHIVISFGNESSDQQIEQLLDLSLNKDKTAISTERPMWPAEFGKWVKILRYIAQELNKKNIACPHPLPFINNNLRENGKWTPADVEMAMYALSTR